jgi:hypothetical protein
MILSAHGIVGSQIASFVGLLDTYPNAAAAYSVRKLRAAYTGSAIRVRRSSDNTETDIGFSSSFGLDTTSLTSFCSGTNGFVTTWYDQSGNARNATQTTAASQPQIVSGGSILTENTKPSIRFNNYYMVISSVLLNSTNVSAYYATVPKSTYRFGGILTNKKSGQDNASAINLLSNGKIEMVYSEANAIAQTSLVTTLFQGTALWDSTNITLRTNGVQDGTRTKSGTQDFGAATWMGTYRLDTNNLGNFSIPELIVYQSDQSANNSGIENNIKTYYGT